MAFSQALRNRSYLHASATLLTFFASWGIWWSFFSPWLTDAKGIGLDGANQGTVYSANSLATLVIMLVYGTIQDRLGLRRHLVLLASVAMSLVGPFFIFVYEPLLRHHFAIGVVVGAVYLSLGYLAAAGLLEAVAERLSRRYGFEYGQSRAWGSFGYAVVALAAGFLYSVNPELNFILGSVLGVICLLITIFWRDAKSEAGHVAIEPSTPSLQEMVALLGMPRLWKIIVLVFFSWTFYTVFDQQMFPNYYIALFSSHDRGQQVYGTLNAIQVFGEAAMMAVVPVLMKRIGVRNTLLLGVTVMCLRIGGCALFHDPVMVSIVKMFHSLEVPLCILSIFRYFTLHFASKLSATLYMVGFQIASQIGVVVLSPALGSLRDHVGYRPTFVVIAVVVACAGIYGWFTIKRDDQDVEGDPFLRSGDVAKGKVLA
ncbi:MFS transporter [Tsukamurella soli]|uniref:MFS transporter n=1 Tax=Tsukamurella soli TaxID=644556 RepID=A0ABP8JSK2_9ACTN